MGPFKDIGVDLDGMVATIEIRRPPHNFFDIDLIREIADACEALDQDPACRAIVLAVTTGSVMSIARSSRCIAATSAAASPDVRAMTVVGVTTPSAGAWNGTSRASRRTVRMAGD